MCVISMNNIYKKYGSRIILEDINLEVIHQDFLCIFGESGCGKTTILNIMGLLEKPTEGEIFVAGKKNPSIGTRTGVQLLRNEIAYVFQGGGLIEQESVYNNLLISEKFKHIGMQQKRKEICNALEQFGLEHILNEKVFRLSGGEKQRVALIGCMLKPSSIILADEPTGNLDEFNKKIVLEVLKEMNHSGKTVVMVTHDEEARKYASRTLFLKNRNLYETSVGDMLLNS